MDAKGLSPEGDEEQGGKKASPAELVDANEKIAVELPAAMLERAEEIMEIDWFPWEDLDDYLRSALRELNERREKSIILDREDRNIRP